MVAIRLEKNIYRGDAQTDKPKLENKRRYFDKFHDEIVS